MSGPRAILTAVRALELSLLTSSLLLVAGMVSTLVGGLVTPARDG